MVATDRANRTTSQPLTPRRRWGATAIGVGAVVIAVDLVSKGVCHALDLQVAEENDGYLLGLGGGDGRVLAVISIVALVPLVLVIVRRLRPLIHAWCTGLVVGGSVANAADRAVSGAVTDFIPVGPVVINLADVALLIGLLVATMTLHGRRHRRSTDRSQVDQHLPCSCQQVSTVPATRPSWE